MAEVRIDSADTRPAGFDDPDFWQLCNLVRDVRALQRGDWSVRARVLRALLRTAPLLRSLTRLPREELYLSDGPAGQRIRARLPRRLVDARRLMAISTLTLPSTFEEYRRGRSRQAFRTNCSRALEARVTVAREEDAERIREQVLDVYARRDEPYARAWHVRAAELHEGEFWFAFDAGRRPLAFAEVFVDEKAALLDSMIAARRGGSSAARYLLMAELLRSLSQRGVRQLVVSRAFSLTPGLVYFQKLLGFSPKNLKVVGPKRAREQRRAPARDRTAIVGARSRA
jgi:hypothetical protein